MGGILNMKNIKKFYATTLVFLLTISILSPISTSSDQPYAVVTTNNASGIGETTATLKGDLNEDGWDVWFTIQEVGSPGSARNVDPDGEELVDSGPFSMILHDLEPSTNYKFWAKADDNNGKVKSGWVKTFSTTGTEKPTVSDITLQSKGVDYITVKSTLIDDGGDDCWCKLKCIETGEEWTSMIKHNSGYTFWHKFNNLEPGQSYTFKGWASNDAGKSPEKTAEFSTEGCEKPTVSTPSKRDAGTTWIQVKTTLTNDGGNPCYIHIERVDTGEKYTTVIKHNSGYSFWRTFDNLEPGKSYTFKSWASNSAGDGTPQTSDIQTNPEEENIEVTINIDEYGTDWVKLTGTLTEGEGCTCQLYVTGSGENIPPGPTETHSAESTFEYTFDDLTPNKLYTVYAKAWKDGIEPVEAQDTFTTNSEEGNIQLTIEILETGTKSVELKGTLTEGEDCTCQLYITNKRGTKEIASSQTYTRSASSNNPSFEWGYENLDPGEEYKAYAKAWNNTKGPIETQKKPFTTNSEEGNIQLTIEILETGTKSVELKGTLTEGEDCTCQLYITNKRGTKEIASSQTYTRSASSNNPSFEWGYENLDPGEEYKAYAKAWNNTKGPIETQKKPFTTNSNNPVVSLTVTNIGTDSVKLNGILEKDGGEPCWCKLYIKNEDDEVVVEPFISNIRWGAPHQFSQDFIGCLKPGKSYKAYAEVYHNNKELNDIAEEIFTTEEAGQIIKPGYKNQEINEHSEFTIETNIAADFTYKYNGKTVENKYSATFTTPYHEDLEEGKDTVLVEVKANDITETAEIRVKDYLKIKYSVDKTEVVEGDDLKITVKDQDNKNLKDALVKVVNENSGGTMSKESRFNGQVIFSKRDYNSLSVDEDVTCTISVEKEGYNLIDGEKTVTVKNAFLKIVSPSSGEKFQEREYVQVTIQDQDEKLFDGAKIELEDSPDRHVYTEDGKAEILAPSVFGEEGEYVEKTLTVRDAYGIYEEDELTIKIKDMWDDIVPIDIQVCDGNTISAEPIENVEISLIRKDSRTEKNHETDKNGMAHIEVYPTADGKDFTYYRVEISKEGYQSIKVPDWPGWKISLDSPPVEVSYCLYNSSFLSNMNQNSDFDVKFTYSPINPKVGDKIKFNAVGKSSEDSIDAWYWDFGDLDISTDKNPEHKYKREGDYIVTLAVKDDNDNIVSHSIKIKIAEDDGRIHLGNFISNFLSQFRNKIKNRSFLSFSISELLS